MSPQMIRGFPILGENDHSQSGACCNGSRVSDWGRVVLPPPRRPPVPFGGNDSPQEMIIIVRDPRASRGVPNRALVRLVSSSEHVWTCFSWLAAFPRSHMCMAFRNVCLRLHARNFSWIMLMLVVCAVLQVRAIHSEPTLQQFHHRLPAPNPSFWHDHEPSQHLEGAERATKW